MIITNEILDELTEKASKRPIFKEQGDGLLNAGPMAEEMPCTTSYTLS